MSKVYLVWVLAIVESILFALIPAVVASAITKELNALTAIAVVSSAVVIMGFRSWLDTRLYTALWLQKLVELLHKDVTSARAKANRWNKVLEALEKVVPNFIRVVTDITIGIVYLYLTVSIVNLLLMLLAYIPLVLLIYRTTKVTVEVNTKQNVLAETEGKLYEAKDIEGLTEYYTKQRQLLLAESNADAVLVLGGIGTAKVAELVCVLIAVHAGVDTVVVLAIYMYLCRLTQAIDKLNTVTQQLYAALTAKACVR